jgi:hypothetical protein
MSGINAAIEQFDTRLKKGRGLGKASLALIEAMVPIVEAAQPITGRGVGYKLFIAGVIPSMSTTDMQRVYRVLKEARERDMIPWEWIVDETRELERAPTWSNPGAYSRAIIRSYRRDHWKQQPVRVEVWSEKGTIRGVLKSVFDDYGVGFRVMHGFASATTVHEVAEDDDGRPLIALYVGDWDPSGLYMSEHDLPERLSRYDGDHVNLMRVALTVEQLAGLPSFPAPGTARGTVAGHPYDSLLIALRSKCPEQVEPERWLQAINDAEAFLTIWGAQAGALGWTARELFGLHPVAERPAPTFRRSSRYDNTGLIWLLQGRPVIALTETEAAIQSAGAVVMYRKHRKPAYGPLGDCLDDMEPRP